MFVSNLISSLSPISIFIKFTTVNTNLSWGGTHDDDDNDEIDDEKKNNINFISLVRFFRTCELAKYDNLFVTSLLA